MWSGDAPTFVRGGAIRPKPRTAGRPVAPHLAALALASHPLAPWGHGLAAREVSRGTLLAGDRRRAVARGLAAGGAGHAGPARGADTRLEQPAGLGHARNLGRSCPSALRSGAVPCRSQRTAIFTHPGNRGMD